jgi:hypothetical protein
MAFLKKRINLLQWVLKGFIVLFFVWETNWWRGSERVISRSAECNVRCKPFWIIMRYKSRSLLLQSVSTKLRDCGVTDELLLNK